MNDKTVTILFTLIGAVIGYFIKHYLDKKKELQNEVNRERREAYQGFVNLIINIWSDSKKNKNALNELRNFYKKAILFASPSVIELYGEYMQFVYNNDNEEETLKRSAKHIRLLTAVLKEMRKDIGLSNQHLGENGEILMKAIIKNFDRDVTNQ